MAVVYSQQYQPIASGEVLSDMPLTVRLIRDLADSINNTKMHALNHKVRSHCVQPQTPPDLTEDERVIFLYAPVEVPLGYSKLAWKVGAKLESGSDENYLYLYSLKGLYSRDSIVDSSLFPTPYSVENCTVNSTSWDIKQGRSIDICRDGSGQTWLMLSGKVSAGGTDKVIISTVDVWPIKE